MLTCLREEPRSLLFTLYTEKGHKLQTLWTDSKAKLIGIIFGLYSLRRKAQPNLYVDWINLGRIKGSPRAFWANCSTI